MAPDTEPGTSPTVLDTFAVTGGIPNARRVGNVISVPDPTTVLMVPAATPASRIAVISRGLTVRADPRPRVRRPTPTPTARPTPRPRRSPPPRRRGRGTGSGHRGR